MNNNMHNVLDLRYKKPLTFTENLDRAEYGAWWYALGFIVLVVGFTYIAWLDSGCELSGVMTWGGKVCVEVL